MHGTNQVLLVRRILAAPTLQISNAVKVLLAGGIMSKIDGHVLIQFFENRIATGTCARQTHLGLMP